MTLRSLGSPSSDDATTLRRYLEQFRSIPFLNGQHVTVTIPTGAVRATANHSLRRAYVGGFVVLSDAGGFARAAHVMDPQTVENLGQGDPKREVVLNASAAMVSDTTYTIWLY